MVHCRWLTTTNRLLSLYGTTHEPSSSIFMEIVQFIMAVYVPVWFTIKKNSSFIEGTKNFFEIICLTQIMPERTRAIANTVLQRNCFFAHQEIILVSLINDHRWAVPRYFFSTGAVGTLERKYRYRSAGTFISQFLDGTRYFCKIFYNKKEVCTTTPSAAIA